jgi:hypothetical protein
MRRLSLIAAALFFATAAHAQMVLPGAGRPASVPGDAMTTLLATTCTDCWVDTSTAAGIGPNTTMAAVAPASPPACASIQSNVINAWSGGTLDTDNEQLLVFGGGHSDYCGNEVYAFKLATLQWNVLRGQSVPDTNCTSKYADGRPSSVHSYDGMAYVPGKGMFQIGGSHYCLMNGNGSPFDWYFNTLNGSGTISGTVNDWVSLINYPSIQGIVIVAVYDATNNRVFAFGESLSGSAIWNVGSGSWTDNGTFNNPSADSHQTCDMQPGASVAWCTGKGFTYTVDLATGNAVTQTTTGDKTCENYVGPTGQGAPGFVWYPPTSKFVCIVPGDSALYLLSGTVWTKHLAGAGSATPPVEDASGNGTFGRVRWDASHGGLIEVSGVGKSVFAYKPGTL